MLIVDGKENGKKQGAVTGYLFCVVQIPSSSYETFLFAASHPPVTQGTALTAFNMNLQQQFVRLHGQLSRLGFSTWQHVTEHEIFSGCPRVYSLFLRFILSRYPHATCLLLEHYDWFIVEADDAALGGSVLRLLSCTSSTTRRLTAAQFEKRQFSYLKMQLCLDLIKLLASIDAKKLAEVRDNTHHRVQQRSIAAVDITAIENGILDERRQQLNSAART